MANHEKLVDSLITKVCTLLRCPRSKLPTPALQMITLRCQEWVATRTAKDSHMRDLVAEVQVMFPEVTQHSRRATPSTAQQGQRKKSESPATLPNVHAAGRKSQQSQPQQQHGSPTPGQKPSTMDSRTLAEAPRAATAMELREFENLSPGMMQAVMSRKPNVTRKVQRFFEDQPWVKSIEDAAKEHERELEIKRNEKLKRLAATREDMERTHKQALERQAAAKREREASRLDVIKEVTEVKKQEIALREARRQKFTEEKRHIEQQLESKRLAQERAKERKQREDLITRKRFVAEIEKEQKSEHDKAVRVRDSLLHFLSDSMDMLEQKRQAAKDQKRKEIENDILDLSRGSNILSDKSEALKREKQQRRVQRCLELQGAAAERYESVVEQRRRQEKEAEERKRAEIEYQDEQRLKREAAEMKKRQQMRQQLVSSLDVELQRKHDEAEAKKAEVRRLREAADREAMKYEEDVSVTRVREKEQQRKLMDQLQSQLQLQTDRMLKPQQLKIK